MAKTQPFDYDGDGKPNTEKDKAMADQDMNNDGRIDKADKSLRQDKLSMDILAVDYKFAMQIVSGNPEVQQTFQNAVNGGWTKERFQAALKNTKWYSDQGTEYARKAWFAKAEGGKQWEDQLTVARDAVQRAASTAGAVYTPDELEKAATDYIIKGYYDPNRQGLFADSIADKVDIQKGNAANLNNTLRKAADDYGISVSDQWIKEAAQSVARGDSSSADWSQWIQEQAAGKHPLYADKIRAGVSVRALASPYLSRMSSILGLNEAEIKLDDPLISQAIGGVDEKGNPKAMNYSDFETKLRQDSRWENTADGANTLMNMATRMAKSWGFSN